MSTLRHITLPLFTLLMAANAFAQGDLIVQANRKYQAKDLDGARVILDEAVKDEAYAKSAEAWVLRGFVYKDIWKGLPAGPEADVVRDEAMASLFISTQIDTAKEYSQSSLQAYDYLSKTVYNDAARALNTLDHERAIALYGKYKESVLRLDPRHAFNERDIEFNNALGTVYTKRFNQDREQVEWFDKAVVTYTLVLGIDSNNYGANYNMATLYYNRGVYNIQRISVGTDIPGIQQIQEVSKVFFIQALPFMLKAHNMNPTRKETLLGLEGIYYSLQDTEQSEKVRHLFESLDPEDQKDK